MLVRYEFHKYFARFHVLFLSVLLIFNIGLTAYQVRHLFDRRQNEIQAAQLEMLRLYEEDRKEYDRIYDKYTTRLSEYESFYYWDLYDGQSKMMPVFENTIIDLPDYGDIQLFRDVEAILHAPEVYRQNMISLLRDAALRIREMEDSPDTYMYRYYVELCTYYMPLSELKLDVSPVRGWNEFFSLKTPILFLTIALVGTLCGTFTNDRRVGMRNILQVCRKGGKPVVRAKLIFVGVTAGSFSVLFSLAPLPVLALSGGLSSLSHPLQMLEKFQYCQYSLTIGQYLLIFVLLRVLVFTAVSLVTAVVGQIYESEKFAVFLAVLLAASSVFISGIAQNSPLYFLQKFSVYEIADIHILFTRYRGINFFGNCLSYTNVIIISILLIIGGTVVLSFLAKSHELTEYKSEKPSLKFFSGTLSLFRTELYKQLICHKYIYVLLALVIVKCAISGVVYELGMNSTERLYMEYIAQIRGEIAPEKLQKIDEETEYIRTVIAGFEGAQNAYHSGEMSSEDYQLYLAKYNYAVFSQSACERLCERRDYLLTVSDSYENVEFIYEEGLNRHFNSSFDIVVILALLLCGSYVFSCEYESSFSKIMRASAKGRKHTFRTKYWYALLLAVGFYVIFSLIHWIFLEYYYDIDYLDAHLLSMPRFADSGLDMSIGEYLILYQSISFFGYLAGILFVCSISVLMENQMKTIITAGTVMVFPALIRYVGIPLSIPDFAYFISPSEIQTGGISYIFCTVFVILGIAAADVKWNHRRYIK